MGTHKSATKDKVNVKTDIESEFEVEKEKPKLSWWRRVRRM